MKSPLPPRRPTPLPTVRFFPSFQTLLLLLLAISLASCREAQIATYRIAKENDPPAPNPAPAPAAAASGGLQVASTESGGLTWTAPVEWKAKPGSAMRKGSYSVGPDGGAQADLAITAFPGDVGGDLANVNRWLGQLGRPAIAEAQLGATLTALPAAALDMKVVDLAGGTPEAPLRMLGAIVPHAGATWFFKLTGPDALVAREKPAFLSFLQTVQASAASAASVSAAPAAPAAPTAAAPADMTGSPVVAAAGPGLKWTMPAHWQTKPASSMRKATFVMSSADGTRAELAVTAFPGDVGGELPNVNRWRGQLGLPPLAPTDLPVAITRVTTNGLAVTLVDFTGGGPTPQRLLGAMVPYEGATWFFKLMGPEALVATEKPAFLEFIQSLSTP
jgi:hypothetical protein